MLDDNTTNPTSTTSPAEPQSPDTHDASNMNAPDADVPSSSSSIEGSSSRFHDVIVSYFVLAISNTIVTISRIIASDDALRASFQNIPQAATLDTSAAAIDFTQNPPSGEPVSDAVDAVPVDANVNEEEHAKTVDSQIPTAAAGDTAASGSSDVQAPTAAAVQSTPSMSTSISSASSLAMANTSSSSSGSSHRSALRGSRPSGMRHGSTTFNETASVVLITPRNDTSDLPDTDASFRLHRKFQQPLAPPSDSPKTRSSGNRTQTIWEEEVTSDTIHMAIPEIGSERVENPVVIMSPLRASHDGWYWYTDTKGDVYIHERSFTSVSPLTPGTSARPVPSEILERLRELDRRPVMLVAVRDADGWFKDTLSGFYINRSAFRDTLPPLPTVDTPVPPAPYSAPQSLPPSSRGPSDNTGLFATSRDRTPSALNSSELAVDTHALWSSPPDDSDTARPRPPGAEGDHPRVYPMPTIRSIPTVAPSSGETSPDSDDDHWPWYPTQGAKNHLMSFARPKASTYPANQDVLFSHTHGMINLTAIKKEARIARRKQLKANLKTVITLGLY
ncbi:hypothetical protein BDZ89DRAFT_480749 [Hymenopellis radicata]|nr:hypothetical protein BDZ89DRAFT_480749 [Hymenopellis radicata]